MKFLPIFLIFIAVLSIFTSAAENGVKKSSMAELAPPLPADPSCRVISCYRNLLNVSNGCGKGEFLHSFRKCEKKFFREDKCCSKKPAES